MADQQDRLRRRVTNALWGLFVGDSLAMPVHWYYNRENIRDHFDGGVTGFESPRHPHPESFMVGMRYKPDVAKAEELGRPYDILREHLRFYDTSYNSFSIDRGEREGEHGNAVPSPEERYHYHHGLAAGDNTLGAQLVRVLLRSVAEVEGYRPRNYITRFVEHLTTPGSNRDPYLEVYIRRWFEAYSRGADPLSAAEHQRKNWSIGSHGGVIRPLVTSLLLPYQTGLATGMAIEHQSLTHRSETVAATISLLVPFLHRLLRGGEKRKSLRELAGRVHPPVVSGNELFRAYRAHKGPGNIPAEIMWRYHTNLESEALDLDALLREETDESIAPDRFATACYPEHGLPLMVYLLGRYNYDPAKVLLANANMGGDNVHRGMILGLIVGAANDTLPPSLTQGLTEYRAISAEIDAFVDVLFQAEEGPIL